MIQTERQLNTEPESVIPWSIQLLALMLENRISKRSRCWCETKTGAVEQAFSHHFSVDHMEN